MQPQLSAKKTEAATGQMPYAVDPLDHPISYVRLDPAVGRDGIPESFF
jgi:hypothetical protein